MSAKVLVAGIGNIFLGDDAFGVEVVRRLGEHPFPDPVRVVDFGIRGYDLAYAMTKDWDLVILADALPRGGRPGTLYILEPELSGNENDPPPRLDAHTMNPVAVLELVRALGGRPGRILVVGCEPETVEPDPDGNLGLRPPVREAVDEAINIIKDLIARACARSGAEQKEPATCQPQETL